MKRYNTISCGILLNSGIEKHIFLNFLEKHVDIMHVVWYYNFRE